jgi:hypothetical protein
VNGKVSLTKDCEDARSCVESGFFLSALSGSEW